MALDAAERLSRLLKALEVSGEAFEAIELILVDLRTIEEEELVDAS